jgi:hypothetical protein
MDIELSNPEKDLLVSLLDKELEEVRSEFHHTDAYEFREGLRCREELLRGILTKLAG